MTNNLKKLEKLINKVTEILEDINTANNMYKNWSKQLDELKQSRLDLTAVQYFKLNNNIKLYNDDDNNHPDTIDLLVMLNLSDHSIILLPTDINKPLGTSLVQLATINCNNIKLTDIDLSLEKVCKFISQIEQTFKSSCLQLNTIINQAENTSDIVACLWEHNVSEWFPGKYYLSFVDDIISKHSNWDCSKDLLYILNPTRASLNGMLSEFCLVSDKSITMHNYCEFIKTNLTDVLNFFNHHRLLDWLNKQKKKYSNIFKDISDAQLISNFYDNFWSLLIQFNTDNDSHNITKIGWLNLRDFQQLVSEEIKDEYHIKLFNRFVSQFNPAQLSKRICSQNVLSMINIDKDSIVKELQHTVFCSNIRITMEQFNQLLVDNPDAIIYNYLIIDDVTTKEFDNLLKSMYLLNHSLYRLLRIKFQAGEIKVQSSNDAAKQISLL